MIIDRFNWRELMITVAMKMKRTAGQWLQLCLVFTYEGNEILQNPMNLSNHGEYDKCTVSRCVILFNNIKGSYLVFGQSFLGH